ncbi:hypothetical protein [Lentzea albida]|uniref:Uncharacterized protein n=1 Tax=Lentzea albida TaxID=65499 RepID=A0A1H9PTN3_9PSEU|nr:hypothetical protein [Lentzea albida]SER50943.1 hypothetical protein SAMN04488000_109233 [Lentzea albida]
MLEEPEGRLWPVDPASTTRAEPGGAADIPVAHSHEQRLDTAPTRVSSGLTSTEHCRKLRANSNLHAVMAEGSTLRDMTPQQA